MQAKRRHMVTQANKRLNGRRAKNRLRFSKIVLEVGEENERRMANNVMRGRRVYDGYLVLLDLA